MIRRVLLIFVPLLAVAGLVTLAYSRQDQASRLALLRTTQREALDLAAQRLAAPLASACRDAIFLAEWIDESVAGDLANSTASRDDIANAFAILARTEQRYDQVRLLDTSGRELVRVDWDGEFARVVPEDRLQDKSARPYVPATLALERGEIHVSRFDLNIEGGEIEVPFEPVVRLSTLVVSDDGLPRGIVILNYFGRELAARLAIEDPQRRVWLVDQHGFWLRGPKVDEQWGFMHEGGKTWKFSREHPEAWSRLARSTEAADQFLVGRDLYTVTRLSPEQRLPPLDPNRSLVSSEAPASRAWSVVSFVPGALGSWFSLEWAQWFGVIAIGLAIIAWFAARYWTARAAHQMSIQRNESRFRGLLEATPDGLLFVDEKGRITFANDQAEQLFRAARDRLVGALVEELVPEDSRAVHVELRDAYRRNPEPRAMRAGPELVALRFDGTEFPAAISLNTFDHDGETVTICVVRDVTEQRLAHREIAQLNERLRSDNTSLATLNAQLDQFTYAASHDLRAPLRAIRQLASWIEEDAGDALPEECRGHITTMQERVERMESLLKDLLDYSRASRVDGAAEPIETRAIVDDVLALVPTPEGFRVEVDIAPGVTTIVGHRVPLEQVLRNLISNAILHHDRVDGRVTIRAASKDGQVEFEVADDGPGIAPTHHERIFQMFQKLHRRHDLQSTGVGLALVKKIVEASGGEISVDSDVGQGATFRFTWPEDAAVESVELETTPDGSADEDAPGEAS